MSEYDVALDYQVDWASFWSSDTGRALFHGLGLAVSKQRQGKGESRFVEIVEHEVDELQLILVPVIYGECYYWSTEILDVVKLASKSLPDSWALMRNHIPSVSGFFYFAKALERGIQAFAWTTLTTEGNGHMAAIHIPGEDNAMPDFNAVAFTSFVKSPDPGFPRPLPCRTTMVLGESLVDWRKEAVRYAAEINADVSEYFADYEAIRLFGTMLTFLQQRILVPSRWSVSRATRKRVERMVYQQKHDLGVNVVKLRSIQHRLSEGQGEPVDWACRWVVRGHWREQWYSSLGKHQPVFISPYIKGPEDKPLRNMTRLFAVVR